MSTQKDSRLQLRLSPEDMAQMHAKALRMGMSLSAFVRAACVAYDPDEQRMVWDALDAMERRLSNLEELAGR